MSKYRGKRIQRTAYMREYRAKQSKEKKDHRRKVMRARGKALTRLSGLHPQDFEMIYKDELAKEGVPDVELRSVQHTRDGLSDGQQGPNNL